jgi:hypothetical protein
MVRDGFGGDQGWPWPTPKSSNQKKKGIKKKNYLKAFGYAYKIKMPIWSLPIQFSKSVSDDGQSNYKLLRSVRDSDLRF